MSNRAKPPALLCALCALVAVCGTAVAQELSPRAYWPAPTGTNIFVAGYQRSSGDIIADPTLPVADVNSRIGAAQVTYQRSLAVARRSASVLLSFAYLSGTAEGLLEGMASRRDVSGVSDLSLRFALNLKGAPAMNLAGFQKLLQEPRPLFGVSVRLTVPTGAYESDRLINVGSNRWALKADLGGIVPFRSAWMAEFSFGAWYFGDNDNFLGKTRVQDPIFATEFHLIRTVTSGFWASFDLNYYSGGQTSVGGEKRQNLQHNSRTGATLFFPFKGGHAIKLALSSGISTTIGQDFDSVQLSYYYAW